jgi:hypothetical protein
LPLIGFEKNCPVMKTASRRVEKNISQVRFCSELILFLFADFVTIATILGTGILGKIITFFW